MAVVSSQGQKWHRKIYCVVKYARQAYYRYVTLESERLRGGVWEYNIFASRKFKLPIAPSVIYLKKGGKVAKFSLYAKHCQMSRRCSASTLLSWKRLIKCSLKQVKRSKINREMKISFHG
ncbi:MAG: hypothetical protein NVS4B7_09220 [Ktedonobacteraceae bacterium]